MTNYSHQPRTETLYELWERRKQIKKNQSGSNNHTQTTDDDDPSSAAWAFCQPQGNSNSKMSGTGISFIDMSIGISKSATTRTKPTSAAIGSAHSFPMIIDISGDASTGKTSTIVTLAARYLMMTRRRPKRSVGGDDDVDSEAITTTNIDDNETMTQQSSESLPQVILFDINRNAVNVVRRVYDALESLFLAVIMPSNHDETPPDDMNNNDGNGSEHYRNSTIHHEVLECLLRLHIARVDDFHGWISVLETFRHEMSQEQHQQHYPTLLLWDDFLDEMVLTASASSAMLSSYNNTMKQIEPMVHHRKSTRSTEITAIRMDAIRQVERLLQECPNIVLVTTSSTTNMYGTYNDPLKMKKIARQRIIGKEWNRFVTHSVHLERQNVRPSACHASDENETMASQYTGSNTSVANKNALLVAIVTQNTINNKHPQQQQQQQSIPFSISSKGIVS